MAETDAGDVILATPEEMETSPAGIVRRWKAELAMADKAEEDWRKESKEIWELYESCKATPDSFNILWSNTETICPAVYNSTPQPDVRRRYRDPDPIGKVASTILERALSYEIDGYDFDCVMEDMVLDAMLCGRGVPRIKYEPHFVPVPPAAAAASATPAPSSLGAVPAAAAPAERLASEDVLCEHVQWDDFRRGPGKRWSDIPWLAFRHKFTYEMAVEKFGPEIAAKLKYSDSEGSEDIGDDRQAKEIFKSCEVWEIWDKDRRRVLFIALSYREAPCLVAPDPLRLLGFFPMPRPLYAVKNTTTLVPTPYFRLYQEQAKELNRVTARINRIVSALKLRGAYAAGLPELEKIIEAEDNKMVPIENLSGIAEAGGLEKAIWMMPIDRLVQVLNGLYIARDQIKQTIYEIMGIGDILRGATDPRETKGAQVLKSQWGSMRLSRVQREIQRMVRDIMRLKAEVMAQQFSPQTLAAITNIQLPRPEDKMKAQGAVQQAQAAGQPPPPAALATLKQPTWDDIMGILRSDELRQYHIDVETDSTVAETISRDMQGISEVLTALSGWVSGAFEAVQQGVMTVDALKSVSLAIVRRARLGSAVEDAIESIEAPPPAAPDQGAKLAEMKQQLLDLLKAEGAKIVKGEEQLLEQQAGLQQYDESIRNAIGQFGSATSATAVQAAEAQRTTQMEKQVLAQLAQVLQQLGAADQGTRGQVQASMSQVAEAVEGVMQGLQDVAAAMSQVLGAINSPKTVTFSRDKNGRISEATAVVTH